MPAMNPALPLLLALNLAGLLFKRREEGLAWLVAGLSGLALLSPALLISDGIPSPSEMLRQLAPWQGLEASASRNSELMDVTFMIEPWLIHLKRELLAGRLPFWNPYQFSGAPFWGNGSSAPLFPLHWLFALLPLSMGFTVVAWLRVVIGGLGAFRLGRELGLSRQASLLVAVAFPLSGRIACFLLFPMANALALVPWVFLAVERLAQGKPGYRLLAVAVGLQLLGGHPETALFTGLAAVTYLALRGGPETAKTRWKTWGAALGGWLTGAALAGAALVPLALTIIGSARWQQWSPGEPMALATIAKLWLRFFLPDAFGHPGDGSYWGPMPFVPTSIYCGALALPLVIAAIWAWRDDHRVRAWAGLGLICLLASYHLPGFRQLLQSTPLLQKSLHHYLLLGFVLAMAVLAGWGLDRFRAGEGRGLAVGVALVAAGLGLAWWVLGREWQARHQTAAQAAWSLGILGAGLCLVLACRLPARHRALLAPAVVALFAADLAFTHARSLPALSAAKLFPHTPAIEFLDGKPGRVTASGTWFRPNSAMVYGLSDVRGDDSLKRLPYERMFAQELGPGDPIYSQPVTRWESPWLDKLAVRWVLTEPGGQALAPGWALAYDGADARIWERPTAGPMVWLSPGLEGASVATEANHPGYWRLRVEVPSPTTVGISENNAPGWRAQINGRPVPIEAPGGLFLGVSAPAGNALVELRYRPPGLGLGVALSVLGLIMLMWTRGSRSRARPLG